MRTWLDELEVKAKNLLPDYVYGYFSAVGIGGRAGHDTVSQWDAVRFRPRAFTDTSVGRTQTTVLGIPVETPILAAPMAQQNAATPQAERATARAAQRNGSLLGVSTNTSVPFSEIAAVGVPWWFQVYVTRERSLSDSLVDRAAAAGAKALMLTVDTTVLAPSKLLINPHDWPESPGKVRLSNLLASDLMGLPKNATEGTHHLSLDLIGELRERSELPVVVKGILRADDARRAVDAGASAILVSTHGGRRFGPSVTALEALPEVVLEVGADCEVYVDSGLRSGVHVAAALAMGARAVFVGRPILWGLATAGEDGASEVLEQLTAELRTVMAAVGANSVDELTRDLLWNVR